MTDQTRARHSIYNALPAEVEDVGSLAEFEFRLRSLRATIRRGLCRAATA